MRWIKIEFNDNREFLINLNNIENIAKYEDTTTIHFWPIFNQCDPDDCYVANYPNETIRDEMYEELMKRIANNEINIITIKSI